jgi:pimeloyl-ACP methyl ester carboxylesterase
MHRAGYARTDDGQQLYYRVVGRGPLMICCNGVGVSTFFFKYIAEHYRKTHSVVVWDYRGHGRSSVPADVSNADLTIGRNAADLEAVRIASGVDGPAILLGHSMGCQVILEYARLYPDNIHALIPMFGTFALPIDTFMDNPHSRKIFAIIERIAKMGGKMGTRMLLLLYASPLAYQVSRYSGLVDKHYAQKVDIDKYLEHLIHMDPQIFLRMVSLMADHDLTDFLPSITVPVLVIAGERDLFTPLHRSQKMTELIPDAELLVLAEASHAAIVEHPDTINRRIDRFFAERL